MQVSLDWTRTQTYKKWRHHLCQTSLFFPRRCHWKYNHNIAAFFLWYLCRIHPFHFTFCSSYVLCTVLAFVLQIHPNTQLPRLRISLPLLSPDFDVFQSDNIFFPLCSSKTGQILNIAAAILCLNQHYFKQNTAFPWHTSCTHASYPLRIRLTVCQNACDG